MLVYKLYKFTSIIFLVSLYFSSVAQAGFFARLADKTKRSCLEALGGIDRSEHERIVAEFTIERRGDAAVGPERMELFPAAVPTQAGLSQMPITASSLAPVERAATPASPRPIAAVVPALAPKPNPMNAPENRLVFHQHTIEVGPRMRLDAFGDLSKKRHTTGYDQLPPEFEPVAQEALDGYWTTHGRQFPKWGDRQYERGNGWQEKFQFEVPSQIEVNLPEVPPIVLPEEVKSEMKRDWGRIQKPIIQLMHYLKARFPDESIDPQKNLTIVRKSEMDVYTIIFHDTAPQEAGGTAVRPTWERLEFATQHSKRTYSVHMMAAEEGHWLAVEHFRDYLYKRILFKEMASHVTFQGGPLFEVSEITSNNFAHRLGIIEFGPTHAFAAVNDIQNALNSLDAASGQLMGERRLTVADGRRQLQLSGVEGSEEENGQLVVIQQRILAVEQFYRLARGHALQLIRMSRLSDSLAIDARGGNPAVSGINYRQGFLYRHGFDVLMNPVTGLATPNSF